MPLSITASPGAVLRVAVFPDGPAVGGVKAVPGEANQQERTHVCIL